jgi:hypothetical protein
VDPLELITTTKFIVKIMVDTRFRRVIRNGLVRESNQGGMMIIRSGVRFLTIILRIPPFGVPQKARCEGDAVPSVAFLAGFSDGIVVGTATPENVTATHSSRAGAEGQRCSEYANSGPFASRSAQCTFSPSAIAVTAIWFLKRQASGAMAFANSPKSQSCHPFLTDYCLRI